MTRLQAYKDGLRDRVCVAALLTGWPLPTEKEAAIATRFADLYFEMREKQIRVLETK